MATSPQTSIPAKPINRRWLWAVRIAALLGPSILWVGILSGYLPPVCGEWSRPLFLPGVGILITLPYLHILLRLAGSMYERGRAIAVTTGVVGSLISFVALGITSGPGDERAARYAACFVVSQLALLITAVVTFHSMGRRADHTPSILRGLVTTVIYLALFLLGFANFINRVATINQASPVGSLRAINTSEVTYASTFPAGFSPTLAALGPGPVNGPATPLAAGLMGDVVASGKIGGYTFTYTPGPKDANGKIQSYTISARPNVECQGRRLPSFFTDQTGVICKTNEDRPATVHDPPLAG